MLCRCVCPAIKKRKNVIAKQNFGLAATNEYKIFVKELVVVIIIGYLIM